MSSSRRPRLTPRGETYLAARDLAITMARADTPTSRAWLEGFIDGMRAHDVEAARARATVDNVSAVTVTERTMNRNLRKVDEANARALAQAEAADEE